MAFAPKKSLGQNFLQDEEVSRWIADQIEPDGAGYVVEVGPGQAALTQYLAGRPEKLLLIEKDNDLASRLRAQFAFDAKVELWHGDASKFDLRGLFEKGPVKLIGNLPYSMGGEILRHFMTPPTPVSMAVFMLQKEVCLRLAARQEDDEYGALSLLVQHDWVVEVLRVVGPESFKPRPRVDSAVVRMTPRPEGELAVHDRRLFDRLVRMGFSQRRKQLKNLLPEAPGGWGSLMEHLGKNVSVRAEELSLVDWVKLTRFYEGRSGEDRGQGLDEMFDVVNERDEVIGQAPRARVHAEGLLHRAVHVFVLNKHGDLWLQQRSHLKDKHPLAWDSSAAGHLDAGEDFESAVRRELKEELGIETETRKVAKIEASERTGWEFVELHEARHSGAMTFAPEEIRTGCFFRVEQVESWVKARPEDFAPGFVRCFEIWKAQGGSDW
ncbi:16S rRNA (adenine(1518)-N(6)/adenine(1519)-N(6))-dimethyltransferase RsmA [Phragmitibacter flavus]|nr:16S rRNA (adenine(1518)-N(6)/adenine(1519)-N(6))-dimethyltransferase RsmA [Phragmitibacter flavus]